MSIKRIILSQWWHGDIVCHKSGAEEKGVVSAVYVYPSGSVQYLVKWPSNLDGCLHEECELCAEHHAAS
jgi:hypothetical protein